MSEDDGVALLVLNSGLFPDTETIQEALVQLRGTYRVEHRDLTDPAMSPEAWDRLLGEILRSEKVITL
jgi:hypothetical protein